MWVYEEHSFLSRKLYRLRITKVVDYSVYWEWYTVDKAVKYTAIRKTLAESFLNWNNRVKHLRMYLEVSEEVNCGND